MMIPSLGRSSPRPFAARLLDPHAADGYEAIRILPDHRVSLLITDLKMPGINGFDLARQLR